MTDSTGTVEAISLFERAPLDPEVLAMCWDENVPDRLSELESDSDPAYRALKHLVHSILDSECPPPARVLDMGCGLGFLSHDLASSGYSMVGNDPSTRSIEVANRLFGDHVDFIKATIEEFAASLERNPFDAVVANMALHATPVLQFAVDAIARALKPNGVFVATIPHPAFYLPRKEGFHVTTTPYEMPGILMDFRIRNGKVHRSKVPYFQRKISDYSTAMTRAGFRSVRLLEKRRVGPGREYDILAVIARKA
jgi:SAM-dependent methyltransferase